MSKVESYPDSVKVLRRLIKRHGELSQDKFDEIFSDVELMVSDGRTEIGGEVYPRGITAHQRKPFKYRLINKELNSGEYFLGGMLSFGDWSKWLEILQAMVFEGLVDTKTVEDKVIYTWANGL